MKILFICNQNRNRSVTAERIFKDRFETKSAGLFNEKPVTEKQLQWADLIVVMEDAQREELSKRFPKIYVQKQILNLDVLDNYFYMQPELIKVLELKLERIVKPLIQ